MGKGGGAKGGKGKAGEGKGTSKYIVKVDLFKWPVKWFLRSYPGPNGEMLMTDGSKPTKHFSLTAVRDMLDGECSELIRRPCMGVNLHACTMQSGLEALRTLPSLPKEPPSDDRKEEFKAYRKTGVPDFKEWLQSSAKKLKDTVSYLNLANELNRDTSSSKKELQTFISAFAGSEDAEARMKCYAQMADCFSRS